MVEKKKTQGNMGGGVVLAECHPTGGSWTACSRCKLETQLVDQLVFPANSATGGQCDNMIVVLKLIAIQFESNQFWSGGQGMAESSKIRLAAALANLEYSVWTFQNFS